MKHALGWVAHTLCLASVLLSIWLPFGGRGQWIATAVVLLLLGAMLLGSPESRADRYTEAPLPPGTGKIYPVEIRDGENPNRPTYGKKAEDDR